MWATRAGARDSEPFEVGRQDRIQALPRAIISIILLYGKGVSERQNNCASC